MCLSIYNNTLHSAYIVAKSNTMDVDFSEVESQAQSIIALINQGLQKATESNDLSTQLVKQLIPDAVEDLHREEKAKAQRDNKQKHDGERALASAAAAMVAARHATQANTPHEGKVLSLLLF